MSPRYEYGHHTDFGRFEKQFRFRAKSFENYNFTFISRGVSFRVDFIHRLHPTDKNDLKAGDFFREFSECVDSLANQVFYLRCIQS